MSKKKKIIIIVSMFVLLCVAGVLNVLFSNGWGNEGDGGAVTTSSFFTTYRTDRESTRAQEIVYLDAIIADEAVSADSKQLAEQQKLDLTAAMEKELVVEGLIKAKGFEDVIVTSSTDYVNVIVKAESLDSSEVAQIYDVVISEMNMAGKENYIKIIPIGE